MHGTEEALDAAAATRLTRRDEDELHLEVGRNLLHVAGCKVGAVIG